MSSSVSTSQSKGVLSKRPSVVAGSVIGISCELLVLLLRVDLVLLPFLVIVLGFAIHRTRGHLTKIDMNRPRALNELFSTSGALAALATESIYWLIRILLPILLGIRI